MMFEIGKLRFLDSFQFLPSSLEKLVEALHTAGESKFERTTKHFPNTKLIFDKGVYPYSYMTSRDSFAETKLPSIDDFIIYSPTHVSLKRILNVHKIRGITLKLKT